MMAESRGRVPDVMQASECPYNKKYPNEPNGITDPEYSIIEFEDDNFENTIKEDNTWHVLPVKDETVTALLYGLEMSEMTYGPYLENEMPKVEHGYYFFYDRHSESKNPFDVSEVLERASLNFTVAIYDAETDILYYAEMDT